MSSEIIELILKLEGKQYFIEEVEEIAKGSPNTLYVFSAFVKIHVVGNSFDEQYISEVFADVPQEHRINAVCLGDILIYRPVETSSKFSESIEGQREFNDSLNGTLFMGFNGSIWAFIEDYTYLIAHNFQDFILLTPRADHQLNYLLKF